MIRLKSAVLCATILCAAAAPAQHWSFTARRTHPRPPQLGAPDAEWQRTAVDAFVLKRLQDAELQAAPEADRRTLIRRLSFDLTGLPPSPEEIAAFLEDSSADAYDRLVERLLASSHYGERWAQHWLDVVRFAETDGFEYDRLRPGLWRYRDYVIQSFNEDKPYDRFILEQVAGDEVDPSDPQLQVAVGFHRLGPVRRNAGNQAVAFSRNEVLTEMTDGVGMVFLGLTVGCARCHDHMFDDFPQADYYRLQAFMSATHEHSVVLTDPDKQAAWQKQTDELNSQIKRIRETGDDVGKGKEALKAQIKELEDKLPPPLPAICTVRNVAAERTEIHVLKRGLVEQKGPLVSPQLPSALVSSSAAKEFADIDRPRTALAHWLADPDHSLTARVFVNRVWQYHFGRGLVETANDFGANGGEPSHLELLDYLANEFVRSGMKLKPLHRLIVLSSTYRMSSARDARFRASHAIDPENRLLWHFPRKRLSAEEVRDAMFSVSGRLNLKAGGESVIVPVEQDLVDLLYAPSQWSVTPDVREHDRRSIYLIAKRNLRLPFAQVFDQPDLQTSCARRESSTHALQALELLNGKTANDLAEAFAARLEHEAGPQPARQVELAYQLAAGRDPTPAEMKLAQEFLATQPLSEFALAMFNLNAFLYVD